VYDLSSQQAINHLGFIEYKGNGGRSVSNKFNKLFVAVDTLSPSNADCDRGSSTVNNIIKYRSLITTSNVANLLFISNVGAPIQVWDPRSMRQYVAWKRRAAHSTISWLVKSRKRIG